MLVCKSLASPIAGQGGDNSASNRPADSTVRQDSGAHAIRLPGVPLDGLHHGNLLQRSRDGDQRAFEQLEQRTSPQLRQALRAAGLRAELIDDLMQTAYLRLWRCSTVSCEENNLTPYLLTTARHALIDLYRRQRGPGISLQDRDGDRSDVPERGDWGRLSAAEAKLSAQEDCQLVRDAIASLQPIPRKTYEMFKLGELTQLEIAEKLGIPLGTVKTRIRTAHALVSLYLSALLGRPLPTRSASLQNALPQNALPQIGAVEKSQAK